MMSPLTRLRSASAEAQTASNSLPRALNSVTMSPSPSRCPALARRMISSIADDTMAGAAAKNRAAGFVSRRPGARPSRARHAGVILGAEILDDDFLDMAVAAMHCVDYQERVDALRSRFADADQNAGGERHVEPARGLKRGQPRRRRFVG